EKAGTLAVAPPRDDWRAALSSRNRGLAAAHAPARTTSDPLTASPQTDHVHALRALAGIRVLRGPSRRAPGGVARSERGRSTNATPHGRAQRGCGLDGRGAATRAGAGSGGVQARH